MKAIVLLLCAICATANDCEWCMETVQGFIGAFEEGKLYETSIKDFCETQPQLEEYTKRERETGELAVTYERSQEKVIFDHFCNPKVQNDLYKSKGLNGGDGN